MIEGWEEKALSRLTTKIGSGATPSGGKNAYKDEGISLIRSQNVQDFKFAHEGLALIDEEQADALRNVEVQENDVLLNITGDSVARCAMVDKSVLPARVNQHVAIVRADQTQASPHFLLYSLLHLKEELLTQSEIGATRRALTKGMLERLPIRTPSLGEQKAIAEVLSSLDDKIALLYRQNATLEALSETLFRQTFIEETQDEWKDGSLIDAIQLLGGGTPQTKNEEYWNGDIPWLSCGDIAVKHRSFVSQSEKSISLAGLQNSSAKLLPSNSTVVTARGTVGKVAILAKPMAFSQSNYGVLPAQRFEECFYFTFLLVNHSIAELESTAYGSVFDTITVRSFEAISLRLPKAETVKHFESDVAPYFERMRSNADQIGTLEELRDRLLPRLVSGQVRLSEFANA